MGNIKSFFLQFLRKSFIVKSFYKLGIFVLIMISLSSASFSQISRNISFPDNSFTFISKTAGDSNLYTHVSISDLQKYIVPGKPELPVKYYKFLLPPNSKVKDITFSSTGKIVKIISNKIFPGQLQEPTGITTDKLNFVPPDEKTYSSTNPYPLNIVKVSGEDYFDGYNHIITIAVYPIQYFPTSNKVELNTNLSFSLNLEYFSSPIVDKPKIRNEEDQKVYDNILSAIVDNPEDIPAYQLKPPLSKTSIIQNQQMTQSNIPFYKYVIITTNAMRNSFNQFIDWKKRKGINIGVVTMDDIRNNYTGDLISSINDDVGSIRQYLHDGWASGVTMYVLLADSLLPNNQHSIPIRYGCGSNNTWDIGQPGDYDYVKDGLSVPRSLESFFI